MFGLEKYDWSIRNNVAAVAQHIVAKNEARNQVALYRKNLALLTKPQDKAAVEALLGLIELELAGLLGEPPGTAEYARHLWVVNDMMLAMELYTKSNDKKYAVIFISDKCAFCCGPFANSFLAERYGKVHALAHEKYSIVDVKEVINSGSDINMINPKEALRRPA